MHCLILYIWVLITCAHANVVNNLIVDYFYYKKTSSVIGYSCNNIIDDVQLVKDLNTRGMTAAFNRISNEPAINYFGSTDFYKLGIILDTRCRDWAEIDSIFIEATNYRMYDELRYWLILGNNLTIVANKVIDEAFGISTDFVIAIPSETGECYRLYDVYNIAKDKGCTLNITFIGNWEVNSRLNISLTQSKLFRRSNLHGLILKASFFIAVNRPKAMSPENYFQSYSTARKESQSKFGYNLLLDLSQLLNCRFQLITVPKWETGDQMGPLVRSLVNNDADITGLPMAMNIKRTSWIKFVSESFPLRSCFMFRSQQAHKIKLKDILRPFDDNVWYLIIILMGYGIAIVAFIVRFDWLEFQSSRISQAAILVVGAICQQGTNAQMTRISTRIAFFSITTFGLLIYNYYSTCVVSARLSEPIMKINDSLSELAKLPLKLGAEFVPWFVFYITRNDWETKLFYEKRWLTLPEDKRFIPSEEGLKLMRLGGFAYHVSPDVAYPFIDKYFNHRQLCELTEVHLIRPTYASFAVKMNSTIVELTKYGFVRIHEVGLRFRQLKKWKYKTLRCRKDILSFSSVGIYEFAPLLFLLLIGFITSLLFIVVEMITIHKKCWC